MNFLFQRLSDWLEDNDQDPDTFDFDALDAKVGEQKNPSAETPEKVPQLEEVSEKELEKEVAGATQLDSDWVLFVTLALEPLLRV